MRSPSSCNAGLVIRGLPLGGCFQFGLGESADASADLTVEPQLMQPPYEPEAESKREGPGSGGAGEREKAELDIAGVEPLPDLIVHLAVLEVTLERPVGPAEDSRLAAVQLTGVVVDLAHAHPGPEPEAGNRIVSTMSRPANGRS
jgi:hypothetical protein